MAKCFENMCLSLFRSLQSLWEPLLCSCTKHSTLAGWNRWLGSSEQSSGKQQGDSSASLCFRTCLWCCRRLGAFFRSEILRAAPEFLANKLTAFILHQKHDNYPGNLPPTLHRLYFGWLDDLTTTQLLRLNTAFKNSHVKATEVNF